jgi:hypothetical protein|tara:strand:+ start:94 stop:342 length:249 start_codon:yes stop_codon:yes gene_type:complete
MLNKSTTQTVVVENTFTVTGANEAALASVLVREVNDETPLVSLTMNVPGRKRGVSLVLDKDQVKDFATLFVSVANIVDGKQS